MNRKNKEFLHAELPIYAIAFNSATHFVLSVSMNGLLHAFPEVKESILMYLLTIATLTGIAGGFLFSSLVCRFSKKNLTVGGMALGCLCALVFLWFPTRLPLLFIAGGAHGLVSGFIATAFPLLVNDHVQEERRSKVIGFGSGVIQFGRLTTLLLGGFLAGLRWNYVYFAYVFMLAALLIALFLLPPDTPFGKGNTGWSKDGLGKLAKNLGVWQLTAITLTFGIVQFPSFSHASLYIEGYGLGPPSMTGSLTSLSCALAGLTGFLFAPIIRVTGKRTYCIAFLAVGIGFICTGTVVSLPSIFGGLVCSTVAAAVFVPYSLLCVNRIADPETAPIVMALIPALMNLGSFLSPLIVNSLGAMIGVGAPADSFLSGGILSITLGLLILAAGHRIVCEP